MRRGSKRIYWRQCNGLFSTTFWHFFHVKQEKEGTACQPEKIFGTGCHFRDPAFDSFLFKSYTRMHDFIEIEMIW